MEQCCGAPLGDNPIINEARESSLVLNKCCLLISLYCLKCLHRVSYIVVSADSGVSENLPLSRYNVICIRLFVYTWITVYITLGGAPLGMTEERKDVVARRGKMLEGAE